MIIGYFFRCQIEKNEWNNAICSNMGWPGDYHTKWNKLDRERQIHDITYIWKLKKNDTNEIIFKTVTDSQEKKIMVTRVGGRRIIGVWDWYWCTTIFKIDNQQGPTVQHREFCSAYYNNLNGKRIWKRIDTPVWITESLCHIPETLITLLFKYTPLLKILKDKKEKMIQSLQLNIFTILTMFFNQASRSGGMWLTSYHMLCIWSTMWNGFKGKLPLLCFLSRLLVKFHCPILMLFQPPSQLRKHLLGINSLI